VHGKGAGTIGNSDTGQSASGKYNYAYNPHTGNGVGEANNNVYADHDGNVYKVSPSSGWQQHSDSGGWSSAASPSSLDSEAAARDTGGHRWGGFRGGGFHGGGFRR
jgi:predicted heme/steroid binding protein